MRNANAVDRLARRAADRDHGPREATRRGGAGADAGARFPVRRPAADDADVHRRARRGRAAPHRTRRRTAAPARPADEHLVLGSPHRVALIGWLVAYMLAQKPVTNVQQLIQQRRYARCRAGGRPHATIPSSRRGAQAPRQVRGGDRRLPTVQRSRRARRHRAVARPPRSRSRRSARD